MRDELLVRIKVHFTRKFTVPFHIAGGMLCVFLYPFYPGLAITLVIAFGLFELWQAAREGDEIALEIWDIVGHYLGTGIANTCVSVGPQRVVLAGGVAAAGDLLIKPVKETLEKRVHVMPINQVEILTSTLGDDAGILGMASWAGSRQSIKTFQG